MSAPTRCLRHLRWLAYCEDCTAWHLSRAIAARDAAVRDAVGGRPPVLTLVPAIADRPARALTVAA
jgi:hypothetical protein